MGLKEKPKNIIYDFYDIDQNGKPGDSPLPFLGMLGPGRALFDQGGALSGGRRESFGGGKGFNPMGKTAQQQNMRAGAAAGDQIDALTARDDMNTTLSSADFKDAMNNPSTTKTRGTLGFLGNRSARKRRRAESENTGPLAPGTTNCLVPPCPQDGGPDTAANLSQEAALAQAAGSTAEPKEKPEPTSSPEGNEGIKTTGGPTGAINIPTQPTVPDTGSGGISEGDYKLTKI